MFSYEVYFFACVLNTNIFIFFVLDDFLWRVAYFLQKCSATL